MTRNVGRAAVTVFAVLVLSCGGSKNVVANEGGDCGGSLDVPCAAGLFCADVPGDSCTFKKDVGCAGRCVNGQEARCGGLTAKGCGDGGTCVDDPTDSCDPGSASDCGGLCAP